MVSVRDHLQREDPLTQETAVFLAEYAEEDDRVDYKQTIDPMSEKGWLEITKDISAFANTYGGYLVFGINDNEKKIVGLPESVADAIKDVNNMHQKINSHLEPNIIGLRAKEFKIEGLSIVIIYIPKSVGVTHMISRNGVFDQPSGKQKTLLQKGTIYVRRSAGNHLADSRDLSDVIERRIDQFRDALLDKVARVIHSPASSDVFILSKDAGDKEGKRFIIKDSPDLIAIKGMSFTIAPETVEEEVAAWSSMSRGKSESLPSPVVLWRWYAHRSEINVCEKYKLAIFQFSLWSEVPAFYWIKGIKAAQIKEALLDAVRNRPNNSGVHGMLIVASFLGRGAYSSVLSALGDYRKRLSPAQQKCPKSGPNLGVGALKAGGLKEDSVSEKKKLDELDSIASSMASPTAKDSKVSALYRSWEAVELDRFLFAQDDRYK
ncbi:MAG: ATP-binding protein [Candidatus Latescibacterota bacterium]